MLNACRSSDNLPPGSPFGQPEFQGSAFAHAMSPEEAEARLNGIPGLPKQLLSGLPFGQEVHWEQHTISSASASTLLAAGLMSLSPDELTLYMQLTEELKKEVTEHQPASSPTAPRLVEAHLDMLRPVRLCFYLG